ncbi:Hypothetical protein PHPALM_11734 [Phytophthora palmivora]|uniref:Avirulence protein (Avh) n=1 Tax=Phytophthora palmivora TaxID=4796 RepID=A0A2P4Y1H8_9STRA|nr:Hypothetical protein PHPALM_11734 [Phytophthora palmivora]
MDGLQDTRDARLLRADKSTHNDGEERASNWFTNFIKQWKPQKAQKVAPQAAPVVTKIMTQDGKNLQTLLHTLVTSQKSTDDVFQVAKLGGQMKPAEMFQPDRLPMYISFSERTFRQRGHDRWGIETLLKKYPEKELAMIANSGFRRADDLSKETAEKLRAGLMNKWFMEKKKPIDVVQLLKGEKMTMDAFNRQKWRDYRDTYNDLFIKTIA